MGKNYDFKAIEKKWQKRWQESKMHCAEDFSEKPKFYALVEFPYPSGAGLHVGHVRSYTALDVTARKRRMEGYNVLYPMGWDAFGLPTENYAIKTKRKPQEVTRENIAVFRRQLESLGLSFDWSREVNTTDPDYYKWTQWIFLQLFKRGLAYKAEMPVNWCSSCKIVLASEEVVNGKCERCGAEAGRKMQAQWMLKITAYAERLLEDLETVDYSPRIKEQQINWIGKSDGALIKFKIQNSTLFIEIFTTRADTIFGATYLVLAPEHGAVSKIKNQISNTEEVEKYIAETAVKSDLDRTDLAREKTGVELRGIKAINPANGEEVPVWVADYVLASYGTGAIMAVPAHDERDFEFAKKYGLPIRYVVIPTYGEPKQDAELRKTVSCFAKRKNDDKFLFVRWRKFGWISPPIGGIDKDEGPEEAAPREVLEETGYKAKTVQLLGGPVESYFFADNKNVWRHRIDQPVLLELTGENQGQISQEEKDRHEIMWLSKEEAFKLITHEYNALGLRRLESKNYAFISEGVLIDSGDFDGMKSDRAQEKITDWLAERGCAERKTTYKLRDWIFSRQHYWGEPIPIVWCKACAGIYKNSGGETATSPSWFSNQKTGDAGSGDFSTLHQSFDYKQGLMAVPVPEEDLPVELPEVERYEPTDTGESPLAKITEWVETRCPRCGGEARRETDTMPNWAGSSWYFLRYCDPRNSKVLADFKKLEYWMAPVLRSSKSGGGIDLYNGGMEHTTLHLLYSRFWHKFLFDIGAVPHPEPYAKRRSHGMVLAEDGQKMSKSRGNVINPDEMVDAVGADSLRLYELFMGPFDQAIPWSTDGLRGMKRFLERVWKWYGRDPKNPDASGWSEKDRDSERILHRTIKKVAEDIDAMRFNTAVSQLMICLNNLEKQPSPPHARELFLKILAPFAPHIAEELWEMTGHKTSIHLEPWPEYSQDLIKQGTFDLVVQINGTKRAVVTAEKGIDEGKAKEIALLDKRVKKFTDKKEIKKMFFVKNKVLNLVVE